MIKAIMAIDDLGGISKDGTMPWPKNSSDLQWFKKNTINTIQRKLQFLRNNKLKCVYCKEMIAYDIYGRGMYKVQTKSVGGFESTLFYTRDFWEQGGFKWEDIRTEGASFCFGKCLERSIDNFYDCIKPRELTRRALGSDIVLACADWSMPRELKRRPLASH